MWIIYADEVGVKAEKIDVDSCVSVLDGIVYYETVNGEYKKISVDALRGFSKIKPF